MLFDLRSIPYSTYHLDTDCMAMIIIFEAAIIKRWRFELRFEVIGEAIRVSRNSKYVCRDLTISIEILKSGDSINAVRYAG